MLGGACGLVELFGFSNPQVGLGIFVATKKTRAARPERSSLLRGGVRPEEKLKERADVGDIGKAR